MTSLEYSMSVKPLTEHHLEFLSLKGGCTCSSEPTLVKIPHCWKSCVRAHLFYLILTLHEKDFYNSLADFQSWATLFDLALLDVDTVSFTFICTNKCLVKLSRRTKHLSQALHL